MDDGVVETNPMGPIKERSDFSVGLLQRTHRGRNFFLALKT